MIEVNFFSPHFFSTTGFDVSTLYWKISSSEWCGSTINRRNIIILFRFGNNTSNKLYNFFRWVPYTHLLLQRKKVIILSMDLVSFSLYIEFLWCLEHALVNLWYAIPFFGASRLCRPRIYIYRIHKCTQTPYKKKFWDRKIEKMKWNDCHFKRNIVSYSFELKHKMHKVKFQSVV